MERSVLFYVMEEVAQRRRMCGWPADRSQRYMSCRMQA